MSRVGIDLDGVCYGEGEEKPVVNLPVERHDLPPGTRVRRNPDRPKDDPRVGQRITVVFIDEPDVMPPNPPCLLGRHRWAWLTSGGQACGICGRRR